MSRITSRLPIIPGSFEDRSIECFCLRKTMSKSGFYRMPEEVRDKLVTVLDPRTLRVTLQSRNGGRDERPHHRVELFFSNP